MRFLQCDKVFWLYLGEMIWGKNMKFARLLAVGVVFAFLAACGDDDSGSFVSPEGDSSSSIEEESSSSVKDESSSSVTLSPSTSSGQAPQKQRSRRIQTRI